MFDSMFSAAFDVLIKISGSYRAHIPSIVCLCLFKVHILISLPIV